MLELNLNLLKYFKKERKKRMYNILQEFNKTNSTNDKLEVMKKYKENPLVQEVFSKCYDKVKWTWGISLKNIPLYEAKAEKDLLWALKSLESLHKREYTGNAGIDFLTNILSSLSKEDAYVIERIIERDLKINFGKTGFNKVIDQKNQITKPPYMRCSIYGDKTSKKISYPAVIQIKADGSFCSVCVDGSEVTFNSRSGEEKELPHLKEIFQTLDDGVYIGELLVKGVENRALANGLLNSDDSKEDVYIQLWDYVSLDEYSRGKDKNNKTPYAKRFERLTELISELDSKAKFNEQVQIIETYGVQNIQEALQFVSNWMNLGFEGGILKDLNNLFIDHTSPTQLKLKLEIDADVRIVGFTEGKAGTKREKTFGAIVFQTDDGTIKGQTSGFTDDELEKISQNKDSYIGKIMTVQFNDITKSRDKDTWALSHPRFKEFRDDKDTTDTLERIAEMKQMAMMLK